MSIETGQALPQATFRTPGGEDGPTNLSTAEIFAGKTVVLFAVPGAFTPTCSMNHLPGFLERNADLRAKGADAIAVVAVNDVFVMKAWREATGAGNDILFLADGNGEFTKAIGLDQDLSTPGFGRRSRRYAMIVKNGVVTHLGVEDGPGAPERSSADAVLAAL